MIDLSYKFDTYTSFNFYIGLYVNFMTFFHICKAQTHLNNVQWNLDLTNLYITKSSV